MMKNIITLLILIQITSCSPHQNEEVFVKDFMNSKNYNIFFKDYQNKTSNFVMSKEINDFDLYFKKSLLDFKKEGYSILIKDGIKSYSYVFDDKLKRKNLQITIISDKKNRTINFIFTKNNEKWVLYEIFFN